MMSKKTSPKLADGMPYKTQKIKIHVWKNCNIYSERRTSNYCNLRIACKSNVKTEKAVSVLTTDVNTEKRTTILIKKLDEVFESKTK